MVLKSRLSVLDFSTVLFFLSVARSWLCTDSPKIANCISLKRNSPAPSPQIVKVGQGHTCHRQDTCSSAGSGVRLPGGGARLEHLHLAGYEHFMHIRPPNELQSAEFVLSISGPKTGALNLD